MPYKSRKTRLEYWRNYYYLFKKEKLKSQKKFYQKNKKRINQKNYRYRKKWRKNNINYKIENRLRQALHNALNYYTKTGKIYSSKKYSINYKVIIEHLKPFPQDLSNCEIHHIVPLHYFNLNDSEQIKIAFAPENHILLTKEQHKQIHKILERLERFK